MSREMKDSGIEWIGPIPLNWEVNKLKNFFKFSKGINSSKYTKEYVKDNGLYPVYSGQTLNEGILGYTDEYEYDVKECLFTTTVGAKVMTLSLLKGKFTLSQNCLIMEKKFDFNIEYFYFFIQALFEYEKSRIPSFMQPSLRIEDLNSFKIALPTRNDQQLIVKKLRDNLCRIDKTILLTNQSIIELKKYKQSIITEAVTKGLNPNVEMKDSEIEWISKIPNHWSTRKINNYFFQVKNKNDKLEEENLLSLSYGTIVKRDIKATNGLLPDNFKSYNIIKKGDIILRMTDLQNDKVSLRTAYSEENGIITSAYITIRTNLDNQIYSKYIQYFLHSFDIYKGFYGMGSGVRQNVTYNDIKKIEILVPPLSEQHEIIVFLDKKTSLIDNLIQDKTKLIEELESYKKSVIYEYVTGKKEV